MAVREELRRWVAPLPTTAAGVERGMAFLIVGARLGTLVQMNPPVRAAFHRQAIWRALQSGLVDVLGSDHAPHTLEEKDKPYPHSPSGMPGVQTLVPVMLDHVNAGRLPLTRMVELLPAGPARVAYIVGKGRNGKAGYDEKNQNYALRLRGDKDGPKLSFLFGSVPPPAEEGEQAATKKPAAKKPAAKKPPATTKTGRLRASAVRVVRAADS